VLGGISAHRHASAHADDPRPGWWEPLVGPGRALDTRALRVLSLDWVGGPGLSSAPPFPDLDHPVPALTPRDQAAALAGVMDALALTHLQAIVGASYGGGVALSFAAAFARRVGKVLVIGSAHESHPLATALRSLQRRVVLLAARAGRPEEGLALARGLAMTTYSSDVLYQDRFAGPPALEDGRARFPVESYLDHHGRRFAGRFTAEQFLCLSQSLDLHRVEPSRVAAPVTLVSIDPDQLAPPWQVRELHRLLGPGHELVEVRSPRGHDAFLTDHDTFASILRRFLRAPGRLP